MRKFMIGMFFLCALVQAPQAALAGHRHHESHGDGDSLAEKFFWKTEFLMRHKADLALTEEQVQKLKDQKFDIKRKLIEGQAQMEVASLELAREFHRDAPEMDRITVLIDQKMEAARGLERILAQAILDAKALLTPEQRAQAKEVFWKDAYGGDRRGALSPEPGEGPAKS